MDWSFWLTLPLALILAALVGTVSAWILSAFTYDHVRTDIDAWIAMLREGHAKQMKHDADERAKERQHMLLILSRVQAMRDGDNPNNKPPAKE